ncbi:MAG: hypothetical protein P4L98_20820 [Ancalomicrobiaceae bacterium]|nr:hypothetical protein [Ancalomicrobiaceae bacterium]
MPARGLYAGLKAAIRKIWRESVDQIDFHDDPRPAGSATDAIVDVFAPRAWA